MRISMIAIEKINTNQTVTDFWWFLVFQDCSKENEK